jgi:hypothetical protein
MHRLTCDEARRIAVNIAKLLALLRHQTARPHRRGFRPEGESPAEKTFA